MKKASNKTFIIVLLSIIVIGMLLRYVIFKDAIDERGTGLQKIADWKKDYKAQHPEATRDEIDAAFEKGINDMEKRKADYKTQNTGATDAEADAALNAALAK